MYKDIQVCTSVYKCVQLCTRIYKCVQVCTSSYWIGLEKPPQNDPLNIKIHPLDQKLEWNFCLKSADLYSRQLIWPSYWIGPEKLPQNDPLNSKICPPDQKLEWNFCLSQLICTVNSWFDLPNVLGLRNYPRMTPQMVKFINWVRKFDGFYLSILRSFRGSVAFWRGSKKVRTPPGVIFGPYKLI